MLKGGVEMENLILYAIGAAALGYFALTVWKKVTGKGGSCCSSENCNECGCTDKKDDDK